MSKANTNRYIKALGIDFSKRAIEVERARCWCCCIVSAADIICIIRGQC